jgi:dolichyl-phosphate beta-glucosyltransferase
MPVQLSVVIPAYNEEKRLTKTVDTIRSYLREQKIESEIIVVSDGSCDRTAAVARGKQDGEILIRVLENRTNRGKGAAVRRGVAAARGSMILFSDADLSTPIRELDKLRKVLQDGMDVVIASRAVRGAELTRHQPFYRELMGKTFNLFVQLLVLPGLHDTQCGFKLFRREIARRIFAQMTIPGFGFDVEILFLTRKAGGRIQELPVCWCNVLESKVSPLRHSLQMFFDLIRIRWRHRK